MTTKRKTGQTPSQTVGPFFSLGLTPSDDGYQYGSIVGASTFSGSQAEGEAIRITGQVLDGEGAPVGDALIEVWQANSHGRYRYYTEDQRDDRPLDPSFHGFARAGTGTSPDQFFTFRTVKPGSPEDDHAPHLTLVVMMRGGLNHVYTRMYFDDEPEANAGDPVLLSVPEQRRQTLIARREDTREGALYHFNIHMQGTRETVFFDI